MHALVINLDGELDRWERISRALEDYRHLTVERIGAINGADLPGAAVCLLTGSDVSLRSRGTLGTFLSHVKAWERIVESSEAAVVVLEDDAVLLGFERLLDLRVPGDADIVFLNDRMSPGSRHAPPVGAVSCRAISEALHTLNRTGFGVGGDGYLLTPVGAKKVLSAVADDLCFGHVDWRLLRYCVKPDDLTGDLCNTRVERVIRHHHNSAIPPAWGVIKGYCLNQPLVAFATGGVSVRSKLDRA